MNYLVEFWLQSHSSDAHTQEKLIDWFFNVEINVLVHENQVRCRNDFVGCESPDMQFVNVHDGRECVFKLRLQFGNINVRRRRLEQYLASLKN